MKSLESIVTDVPRLCVGVPDSFTEAELDDFTALVLAGGEVAARGLRERVTGAAYLAFARAGECLVGVAGLKRPEKSYRSRIELSSKEELPAASLPFELGWVFVLPSARGRKISALLCRQLVAHAEQLGIFATSRTDNTPMHRTLDKLGFKRAGQQWPSKDNDAKLALFIRNAV